MPTLRTLRWPDTPHPATPPVADRFTKETMTRPAPSKLSRLLYGILAYVSLGIGLVAIVIPGLPTTEFILLAAWAATRSSPRLSAWLENHRLFGPILYNWRNGKVIQRRAKVSATVSMLLCAGLMLTFLEHHWPVFLAIAGMTLGNLWIWSRPEHPCPAGSQAQQP